MININVNCEIYQEFQLLFISNNFNKLLIYKINDSKIRQLKLINYYKILL